MTQQPSQLPFPSGLPAPRRAPRCRPTAAELPEPLSALSHVQLRSELTLDPGRLTPTRSWLATASLRLVWFQRTQSERRKAAHAALGQHLAAWLVNQPARVGLQLVLATHPGQDRVHIGLRVEVSEAEVDQARAQIMTMGREVGLLLGEGNALEFEPDHPGCGGLAWLAAPEVRGLAAHPLAPAIVVADGRLPALPEVEPDPWGEGDELLRLMLAQLGPTAVLVSMRRADAHDRLEGLEDQLALIHARLISQAHGLTFTSAASGTITRQFPEDLLHIGRATERLARQAAWVAELRRGAVALQVHLLGTDEPSGGLAHAAQRAFLRTDAHWSVMGADQCALVKAGPLAALDCPAGPSAADEDEGAPASRSDDLMRLVPAMVAARALCLPPPGEDGLPGLPQERAPLRWAPPHLAGNQGLLLGTCRTRRATLDVRLRPEDLDRHLYVVGKTGTGKTTLLRSLMFDLRVQTEPFAVIDPHGDLSDDLIERLGKDRDVVVFDPARDVGPGLNPLANDGSNATIERALENVTRSMFQLYPPEFMGPIFERQSRALLLPLAVAGEGMDSVGRIAHDRLYRKSCLSRLDKSNPLHAKVIQVWEEEIEHLSDSSRSELENYVISKYDALVRSSALRAVLDPRRPQLDLGAIMDRGQTLIARLPQGELGAISAWFLGMMLVSRLQDAVFARSRQKAARRRTYTLVLDEFQHFLGGGGYGYRSDDRSLGPFLSETRKYGLRLALAHQHLAQCDERTREAVMGNVGSMVVFRVGYRDAELLARELGEGIDAEELRRQPLFRGLASLLVRGAPARPFSLQTIPPVRREP